MGIKQIEQFSDIILRILRFLAESSGVTKLELFHPFPIANRVSAGVPTPPTIGRRTAQFCFGLLMRCFFLGSTPLPPWTPNAATLRVGLCMSPGIQYHPVKEHSIYLKPDESFVYIGGRVSIS